MVKWFAGKEHLGFYPEADGVEMFKYKLAKHKTAKGSIQFPYKKEIPHDLIREIIELKRRGQNEKHNLDMRV